MESVPLQVVNKKEPLFYLFKHKNIDGLQLPLKGSSRVKVSFDYKLNETAWPSGHAIISCYGVSY